MLLLETSHDREVPSLLGDPSRVGSAGGAGEMDTPRGELDEEQDLEGLQEHGLDREEIAGESSLPLRSQELAPRRTPPPWRRPEAGLAKNPPDGARSDPDPQLAELP